MNAPRSLPGVPKISISTGSQAGADIPLPIDIVNFNLRAPPGDNLPQSGIQVPVVNTAGIYSYMTSPFVIF